MLAADKAKAIRLSLVAIGLGEKLSGIGIFDNLGFRHCRNAKVDQRRRTSVDDLVGGLLSPGWSAERVTLPDRIAIRTETIFAGAFDDEKQLILHVMVVEWTAGFAWRDFVVAYAETSKAEKRAE